MVWSIVTGKGRRRLIDDASRSRADAQNRRLAVVASVLYVIVGTADIWSTHAGVTSGVAEEINPFMRAAMENFGTGWIAAKLFLQAVICAMVFWFPHRIVVTIFLIAIAFNALIVINNFRIVFSA